MAPPFTSYGNQSETPARLGEIRSMRRETDVHTMLNKDPQANQITTLTLSGTVNPSDVFSAPITFNGKTYANQYVVPASGVTTLTQVASQWSAQMAQDPNFSGMFTPSPNAAVITLTGKHPSVSFVVNDAAANVAANTTVQAARAASIPFGRGIVRKRTPGVETDTCALVSETSLKKRKMEFTPLAEDNVKYHLAIIHDGISYPFQIDSGASATPKTIVEALQPITAAAMPANSINITEDDTKLILESAIEGLHFEARVWVEGATTGSFALTSDNDAPECDINKVFAGAALSDAVYDDVKGPGYYPANSGVRGVTRGEMTFKSEENIDISKPVYVRVAEDGNFKQLAVVRSSPATGCVKLDPSMFRFTESLTGEMVTVGLR